LTPSECKYQIVPITPLVFIDISENSIMANDVVAPLNPLVVPIKEEKLEETSLDVNVSQRSRFEEPFERVVRT
jgi:hypothetical protein